MSEPSASTSKTHFSISRLISDLKHLSTPFLSHPLYVSYLVFFSPYIFKLISFLYPLFLTTFLISLASLLFLVHDLDGGGGGGGGTGGYLLITYASLVERWRRFGKLNRENTIIDQEEESGRDHQCSESLQIYEILFGSSSSWSSLPLSLVGDEGRKGEADESAENRRPDHRSPESSPEDCVPEEKLDSSAVVCDLELRKDHSSELVVEEKRMEKFLRILDEFEKMSARTEKPTATVPARNGSQAKGNVKKVNVAVNGENASTPLVKSRSQRLSSNGAGDNTGDHHSKQGSSRDMDYDLRSYGSMRKEKEWKRTLACKLFEERHNVDGGEGMDSLWEAYEMDSNKPKSRNADEKRKKEKNVNKNKNKIEKKMYDDDDDEEKEQDEEEIGNGQLCCLQALKLSAGKMSMGMGRPNLVKITKAIKGFGWLHSVSSKHSKKVHNSGDHKDRY